MTSRWRDPATGRDVFLIDAEDIRDWPVSAPWKSAKFGLLLLAARPADLGTLPERALGQGAVFVAAWGPECETVHDIFDETIVGQGGGDEDTTVLTTWHADESLEDALTSFLEVAHPAPAHAEACRAWVFFPVGAEHRRQVERALSQRGARRGD
jgi:hypothetical protein